jgi:hypothetical protein
MSKEAIAFILDASPRMWKGNDAVKKLDKAVKVLSIMMQQKVNFHG